MQKRGARLDLSALALHPSVMKCFSIYALLAFCGTCAQAETRMTPEQFGTFTEGSTVYFNRHGQPYGAEQYLSHKRVIWTFFDGTCQRGTWYGAQDEICFIYDNQSEALCWHFLNNNGRRTARIIGDDPADDLTVTGQDHKALSCPGPEVGVSFKP